MRVWERCSELAGRLEQLGAIILNPPPWLNSWRVPLSKSTCILEFGNCQLKILPFSREEEHLLFFFIRNAAAFDNPGSGPECGGEPKALWNILALSCGMAGSRTTAPLLFTAVSTWFWHFLLLGQRLPAPGASSPRGSALRVLLWDPAVPTERLRMSGWELICRIWRFLVCFGVFFWPLLKAFCDSGSARGQCDVAWDGSGPGREWHGCTRDWDGGTACGREQGSARPWMAPGAGARASPDRCQPSAGTGRDLTVSKCHQKWGKAPGTPERC